MEIHIIAPWVPVAVVATMGFIGGVASTFMVMWPKLEGFKVAASERTLEIVEGEAA